MSDILQSRTALARYGGFLMQTGNRSLVRGLLYLWHTRFRSKNFHYFPDMAVFRPEQRCVQSGKCPPTVRSSVPRQHPTWAVRLSSGKRRRRQQRRRRPPPGCRRRNQSLLQVRATVFLPDMGGAMQDSNQDRLDYGTILQSTRLTTWDMT